MDNIEQIAERVGLSRTTVSRDLKWLSGALPNSSGRYFRVIPDLNEPALGLTTVDAFLATPDILSIERLERLCDNHPYTKYRARCYGNCSGLFVQFRVPIGTESMISSLFKGIKAQNLITHYSILPTTEVEPIFSVSRLQHWNSESFSWDFDWTAWASSKLKRKMKEELIPHPMIDELDVYDINILTHLSYGARRKQKEIMTAMENEGIHVSSQDFSRRLAHLNEHFINNYIVFLDTDAFDLYSNVILTARTEFDFSAELTSLMKNNPIPFRSTLKIKDDFLLWFLMYLQSQVHELKISLLDYRMSAVYGVWAGAFDNGWKRDRKFMVTDVLNSL